MFLLLRKGYFNIFCFQSELAVPRKNTLPAHELEILARLKSCRCALELPRRLFAKAAGLDSSVIVRLELGRMPLRFGVARALCAAHEIDAEWLTTGQGGRHTPFAMAALNQIQVDDNALFSDVFKNMIAPARWDERPENSANLLARSMLGDEWATRIGKAFEIAPPENIGPLDEQLRAIMETLVGRVAAFPEAKRLLRQLATQKKMLTQVSLKRNTDAGMKSEIQKLIEQVKQKASEPGAKTALAKKLKVAPARISEWLSGAKEPGGNYALILRKWVNGEV